MRSGAKTKADTNMAYLWIINNLLGLFQLEMKAEFKEAAVHLWEQFWLLTPTHMRTRRIKIHQQLRPSPFPSHHSLHAQVIFFPSVYSLYSWPCVSASDPCPAAPHVCWSQCLWMHPTTSPVRGSRSLLFCGVPQGDVIGSIHCYTESQYFFRVPVICDENPGESGAKSWGF